uniref:Large ribosomal subunit protein mL64 n=1 Tax=Culicoides sonorensis TaxID=179676 RepID=A0A336LYX0_CULSO
MSQLNKINLLKFLTISRNGIQISRHCSKTAVKSDENADDKLDSTPAAIVQDDDEDVEERKRRIDKIRNKSRLLPNHRNMLMGQVPYPDGPESWIHTTLKYKRGLFGKYGLESGVDPRICYPTATEKADQDEFERVAYPFTLQEMQKMNAELRKEKEDAITKREEDIAKKLGKLDGWMAELNAKIAKKEADARAAKERKERLVEEVRRHFGYTIDVRDEKFKEMLAIKEKEDKKAQKEARKKQKEMKMLEKLITKGKAAAEGSEPEAPQKS